MVWFKKLRYKAAKLRHKTAWQYFKSHKILLAACLAMAVALILGSGFVIMAKIRSPGRYYKNQLHELSQEVGKIGPSINMDRDDTLKNLDNSLGDYDKLTGKIISLCRPLTSRDKEFASRTKDKKLLEVIMNSKLLCNDLTNVSAYSRHVYGGSRDFFKLNTNLPPVDAPEYAARINEVSSIVQKTQENLRNIDNSKVGDPGLNELIGHLDDANKQIILIRASLEYTDFQAAQTQSEQLAKNLADDKKYFLDARSYFWNNTVRLEALEQAINKLSS